MLRVDYDQYQFYLISLSLEIDIKLCLSYAKTHMLNMADEAT